MLYSFSAVNAFQRKTQNNKTTILSQLQSLQKICSPSPPRGKTKTTGRLSSPPRFVFHSPLLRVFVLPGLSSALLWTVPCLISTPGKAAAGPGRLLIRHRYTDGTLQRHCIMRGASHVTLLGARVAFKRYGWKFFHQNTRTVHTHTHTPLTLSLCGPDINIMHFLAPYPNLHYDDSMPKPKPNSNLTVKAML